jgi:hypothetical protein
MLLVAQTNVFKGVPILTGAKAIKQKTSSHAPYLQMKVIIFNPLLLLVVAFITTHLQEQLLSVVVQLGSQILITHSMIAVF